MLNSGEEIWDEMEAAPDPHYIESALSNFQTEVNFAIEYLTKLLPWVYHWLNAEHGITGESSLQNREKNVQE